jgi:Domain of unknown function (DUF4403)
MRFARVLAILLASLFLNACNYIATDPNPPVAPQPTISPSQVSLTVSVPLALAQSAVNNAVPSSFGVEPYNGEIDGGADDCSDGGANYGFGITRDAIGLSASGSSISASTGLHYWMKARGRTKVVFFCSQLIYVSCGVNEPQPGMSMTIQSTFLGVDPSWSPQTHTSLQDLHPLGRCKIGFINYDITDSVVNGARDAINRALPTVDQAIASGANLRARAQQGWSQLLNPIQVTDGVWLSLHPQTVGVFPLQGNSQSITAGLQITARPELTVSNAPPPPDTNPLPAPATVAPSNAFSVELPVEASTAEITTQLQNKIIGFRYPASGIPYAVIKGVSLAAYGSQVVLKIDAKIRGEALFGDSVTVYLQGTPAYDPANNVLTFPDLTFTDQSSSLLLNLYTWLDYTGIVNRLRAAATLDLSTQIGDAKTRLQNALNQNVGPLSLSGTVGSLNLLAVYTDPQTNQLKALFQTSGTLNATLH